jgi:hypothetical protein
MFQAFYNSTPKPYAPYRELVFKRFGDDGWCVRIYSGLLYDDSSSEVTKEVPVKSFDDGMSEFDRLFKELSDEGWSPYDPRLHPHLR